MAKSKSFFGLRTGSTKSLTFSVYRGTQVTKDRVTRVANPRTIAQMQQRAKVPLVAAARVALAGLVDHSFEGVPYGQASLQKFSSLNLANGALNVASYPPNGVSNMGCADFIVSQGSLVNPFNFDTLTFYGRIALPALGAAKIFPEMPLGTKGSTVAYFANKAFALNYSWRENSQLTSLVLANEVNYVINNYGGNSVHRSVPLFKPFIMRFVFPDSYPAGGQTVESLEKYHDDNDYWKLLQAVPAEGADIVYLGGPNGERLNIAFEHENSHSATIRMSCGAFVENLVGGCLIFSQLDGTTWKRSNERIMLAKDDTLQTFNPFTFTDWMQAYTGTVVTSKYLNTGNAATGISGQRPPRKD